MNPERHPRTVLTRERILAEALALIDAGGVEHLSMRQLGKQLGVDPMAVYYHVPSKAALHDGIVEHLWMTVGLPPVRAGEQWPELLYEVFSTFRRKLLEHPRAAVLVGTRPAVTAAMLRLFDDTLQRLAPAGLVGKDAMQLLDCLSGYTIGKVLAELHAAPEPSPATASPAFGSLDAEAYPHLAQAMASGYEFAPQEEFERGLRAMLAGWETLLSAEA